MKKITIFTLYPGYFHAFLNQAVIGKGLDKRRDIEVEVLNIRDFTPLKHGTVDDYPIGGGAGMIMRPDVLKEALQVGVLDKYEKEEDFQGVVFSLDPKGETWNQNAAEQMAREIESQEKLHYIFFCGRFEGIDERFLQLYVDRRVSMGDFILTGAELGVMMILDSTLRLMDGFLGNRESLTEESFNQGLEYPLYTKPRFFEGLEVPEVLYSGHHQAIADYRKKMAKLETKKWRPDLLS